MLLSNVKEISWDPETGLLEGKFYPPVYEYCPHIDRNLLYSTISDHAIWFDTDVNISNIPDNVCKSTSCGFCYKVLARQISRSYLKVLNKSVFTKN